MLSCVWLFCDPMDCNPLGSSCPWIFQSGLPFPSPGDLCWLRDGTKVSCTGRRFFTTEPPGKHYFFLSVHFSSVQLLWSHGLQHTRLPSPSPTPGIYSNNVHRVSDAIQPSHLLSSPSPPAFSLSQHQGLLQWVSSLHQLAKVLELQLQHQSFQWIFRTDFL